MCRPDAGIRIPKDLEGKRVWVRAYSVTTGIWTRGILQNEYGVDLSKIIWVVDDEEHVQSVQLPPTVVQAPAGRSLADLMAAGELHAAFPLAQIVFVGGSLMEKGGHNMVEPAAAGAAIVTGPHTHNFQNIIALMKAAGAIIQVHIIEGAVASRELSAVFARLLENRSEREELGRRAKQLVLDNQGTADRTVKIITPAILAATHTS